ncbi:collagen alpha-2(I) chain-like [Sorex fumeus]|uniref:collagen alpha-2(I) chain-like n=1 Tax=Sorex fumeus TaxID=62283 RepID=UPI0024AE2FEE|nr:collagen alpha-2(I) chain-like [Sorex fumeus]
MAEPRQAPRTPGGAGDGARAGGPRSSGRTDAATAAGSSSGALQRGASQGAGRGRRAGRSGDRRRLPGGSRVPGASRTIDPGKRAAAPARGRRAGADPCPGAAGRTRGGEGRGPGRRGPPDRRAFVCGEGAGSSGARGSPPRRVSAAGALSGRYKRGAPPRRAPPIGPPRLRRAPAGRRLTGESRPRPGRRAPAALSRGSPRAAGARGLRVHRAPPGPGVGGAAATCPGAPRRAPPRPPGVLTRTGHHVEGARSPEGRSEGIPEGPPPRRDGR